MKSWGVVLVFTCMVLAAFAGRPGRPGGNPHNHARGTIQGTNQNFGCKRMGFARRLQEEDAEGGDAEAEGGDDFAAESSSFEASASGDPHWNNFKKEHFDHMGLGEYQVARTKNGYMKYFTWQAPASPTAAVIKGSMIKMGDHRVEVMEGKEIKVNGKAVQGNGKKTLKGGTTVYYQGNQKVCADAGDHSSSVLVENGGAHSFRVQIKPSAMPPKGSSCAEWSPAKGKQGKEAWDFCGKHPTVQEKKADRVREEKHNLRKKPEQTFSDQEHLHKKSGMPGGKWPKNYKPASDAADACKQSGVKFSTAKKECKSMASLVNDLVGDAMDADVEKNALQDCIFDYCSTGEKDMIARSMVFVASSLGGKDIDVDDAKLKEFLALYKGVDKGDLEETAEDLASLIM